MHACVFLSLLQKTRYQAGMRNSENLTANSTFSKPTRYQVTTLSKAWAEVDPTEMDPVTLLCEHRAQLPPERLPNGRHCAIHQEGRKYLRGTSRPLKGRDR